MEKRKMLAWVKALRSGKYEQGLYSLKKRGSEFDKFCCLGVLCEISRNVVKHEQSGYAAKGGDYHSNDVLDGGLHIAVGLSTEDGVLAEPVVFCGKTCTSLAALNDAGASFKYIANVIEKQYKEL